MAGSSGLTVAEQMSFLFTFKKWRHWTSEPGMHGSPPGGAAIWSGRETANMSPQIVCSVLSAQDAAAHIAP